MKIFKKGKYYIGDPCYVFNDDNYKELINNFEDKIFKFKDEKCAWDLTAFGDGDYYDNYDRKYMVDSGTIAIIPENIIDISNTSEMIFVEFKEDFEVSIEDGIFEFGDIVIDTN